MKSKYFSNLFVFCSDTWLCTQTIQMCQLKKRKHKRVSLSLLDCLMPGVSGLLGALSESISDRVPNYVNAKRSISRPCTATAPSLPKWILINPAPSSISSPTSPTSFLSLSLSIPSNPLLSHTPSFFLLLSSVPFPLSVNNSFFPHTTLPSHTNAAVAVSGFPQGLVRLYSRLCGFSQILIRTRCRCEHPDCCLTTNCLAQQKTHKYNPAHTHT